MDANESSDSGNDGIWSPITRLFRKITADPEKLLYVAGALLSAVAGVVVGREAGMWDFGGPACYAGVSLAFSALAAGAGARDAPEAGPTHAAPAGVSFARAPRPLTI